MRFVVDDLSLHDWSSCPRSARIVAPIPPKYAVPGSTVFVGHAVAKEIRLLYTATLMSITDVDLQFDDVTTLSTPYILDRKRSHKHWFQFQESDVQEQCTLTAFGIRSKGKIRRSDDAVLVAAATAGAAATAPCAHDDGTTDIANGVAADAQADHDPHAASEACAVDETGEMVKKVSVSAADAEQADAASATPRSKVDEIVEGTVAVAEAEQSAAANAVIYDTAERWLMVGSLRLRVKLSKLTRSKRDVRYPLSTPLSGFLRMSLFPTISRSRRDLAIRNTIWHRRQLLPKTLLLLIRLRCKCLHQSRCHCRGLRRRRRHPHRQLILLGFARHRTISFVCLQPNSVWTWTSPTMSPSPIIRVTSPRTPV
jgi:hypothetical protein